MANILLVEDDPDQLELRAALLERGGHTVRAACCSEEAVRALENHPVDAVLMDLCLPTRDVGEALLAQIKSSHPLVKVVVLTGWTGSLEIQPDATLRKPVRSEQLLRTLARLAVCLLVTLGVRGAQREYTFAVPKAAEVVAHITFEHPHPETVTIEVSGKPQPQHLVLYDAPRPVRASLFLGQLAAGPHTLKASIDIKDVRIEQPAADVVRHAPILYARPNTVGKNTDVPLVAYATKGSDAQGSYLEYNVIFSNEDGGTSTRNLMARWGRTTDIEYIYKVWLKADGSPARAIVQGKDHKDIEYTASREDWHPLLMTSTDNNMVSFEGRSPVRYQLAPRLVDLSQHSREQVMDEQPFVYGVSARELEREGKLRAFGTADGEKISDPRNYLVIEAKLSLAGAGIQALARVKGETEWRASSMGMANSFIDRSGWIRTAIELPPQAHPDAIAFQCMIPKGPTGRCTVEAIGKVFLLNADYTPGGSLFSQRTPLEIVPGTINPVPIP